MPAFTPDDVDRIAELARLALTDAERALFARQLADILAYAEQVQAIDTSGVAATAHVLPGQRVERDDEPRPSLPVEDVLRNAPRREGDFFKVPPVLEEA